MTVDKRQGWPLWSTFATNVVILSCGVITGVLTARSLLPEGRGTLALVLFWPQLFAGVGLLSLPEAITREVAREGQRSSVSSTGNWLGVILAILTAVCGVLVLPFVVGSNHSAILQLAQIYLLCFIPLNFVVLNLLATAHGQQRFRRYNLVRLAPPLTYLASLVALAYVSAVNVMTVVWANWLGTAMAAVILLFTGDKGAWAAPGPAEGFRLIRTAAAFHLTAVFAILATQLDRVIVMTSLDTRTIGLYAVALTVANSGLPAVAQAYQTVLFPSMAQARDQLTRKAILVNGLRNTAALLFVGGGALAVSLPWLLPIVFGTAFAEAVAPSIALVAASIPLLLRQLVGSCLRAIGDARPGSIAEIISTGVFVGVVWPAAWLNGLVGIGIALGVGHLAGLTYLCIVLRQRLRREGSRESIPVHLTQEGELTPVGRTCKS